MTVDHRLRTSRAVTPRVAASLVALLAFVVGLLAPAPADAQTRADRFAQMLRRAERGRGVEAHLGLSEAQVLAPLLADGWARLVPVAERLVARSRVPWLRGEAHGTLAVAARATDLDAAREHVAAAGIVNVGAVLGPLAGPGADEAPPAFDPDTRLQGQHALVAWRPFSGATVTGPLQLADLLGGPTADAHAFVTTAIDARVKTDVMLVVGSNGPVAAWVDGRQVLSWDGERALSDWQHAVPLTLARGTHHLTLRVGHAAEAPQLIARVVDRRGLTPAGLTLRPPRAGEALAGAAPSRRLPPAMLALAGDDPRLRGEVGLWIAAQGAGQREAALALEEAVAATPDDPEIYYLLGRAERADLSRARGALERAVALSGGRHAAALATLLDLHRGQGLDAAADATARLLAQADPGHPAWLAHETLRVMELADAGAASPTLADHPLLAVNARLATVHATLLDARGRHLEAARAWAAVGRLVPRSGEAAGKAILGARRAADPALAVAWADEALARRPYALELHILRARALVTGPGGPAAGIAAIDRALALHPDSPELLQTRGRLLLLSGDRGDALAAFDRALEIQPQNRGLADYRRTLVAGRSLSQRYAEDVAAVVAAAPAAQSPRGATYLLDRHAVVTFPSGLSSHFRQLVIRIESELATDRFEQQVFPFTPGEDRVEIVEAEVIHADGTRSRPRAVFDHQPGGKQMGVYTLRAFRVVRFEPLEPGDVVHLQVRRDEIGDRNLFRDFFGILLPLQADYPKARVDVLVDAPADRPLYAHAEKVPAATVTREGDRQQLSWRIRDLPAIAVEPRMPGYGDVAAYASVSTFPDWDHLARWYRELVAPQLALSRELRATAQRLAEGATSDRDKVAAVLAWVLDKTRYVGIEFGIHGFKPYRVVDIVKRGYGDCKDKASLLVAMLEAVGVRAEIVLVRTRDNGALADTPATLWAFNHAIAYVPSIDTYVDGTSEHAGLGELPELDQGAMVLRVDLYDPQAPAVLARVPVAPPAANRVATTSRYEVSASGDATLTMSETVAGSEAARLRAELQDESRRDARVAELLAQQHAGATLTRASYANLDALGRPVRVDAAVTLPGFATREGERLEIPVNPEPGYLLDRYGALVTRAQPLVLDHTVLEEGESVVRLPAGASVDALPEEVRLSGPFGSFGLAFAPTADGYRVVSRLEIGVDRVEPADYPAFRTFLEQVARAEAARVTARLR